MAMKKAFCGVVLLFCILCLIPTSHQEQPAQSDVVIEETEKAEENAEEEQEAHSQMNEIYMKAIREVESTLAKETPEDKEKRILKIYACALMVRVHQMKTMDKLKAVIESHKDRADMIFSKIMASMAAKCIKQIAVEDAQTVPFFENLPKNFH